MRPQPTEQSRGQTGAATQSAPTSRPRHPPKETGWTSTTPGKNMGSRVQGGRGDSSLGWGCCGGVGGKSLLKHLLNHLFSSSSISKSVMRSLSYVAINKIKQNIPEAAAPAALVPRCPPRPRSPLAGARHGRPGWGPSGGRTSRARRCQRHISTARAAARDRSIYRSLTRTGRCPDGCPPSGWAPRTGGARAGIVLSPSARHEHPGRVH